MNVQALYARLWGSGFLPSKHQGTSFQTTGDPVLFLSNPKGIDEQVRRRMLDSLAELNRKHFARDRRSGDPDDDRPAGDGLPHANIRPGAYRYLEGAERGSRTCMAPRSTSRAPTPETACSPGGWPSGMSASSSSSTAGGITTPACPENLQRAVPRRRSADRRAAQGPQRCADLLEDTLVVFAGEFGRTVYGQGNITPRQLRARPPPALLLRLAGRRRDQRRHPLRQDRRLSATTSSRIPSTCATSTPPCSTCSGSITIA